MTHTYHPACLRCDRCGAPLAAQSSSGLVRCEYCGSHCSIFPADGVDHFPDHNLQTARIDSELEHGQAPLEKSHFSHPPHPAVQIIAVGAAAAFGIFWTFSAINAGAPLVFALFGLVFVALVITGLAIHLLPRSSTSGKAEREYSRRQDRMSDLTQQRQR